MKKKTYTHLTYEERYTIEKLWNAHMKIRSIAEFLGRSPNTVSREIRRNSVKGEYLAKKADHRAYVKRWRSKRQCMKISMDPFITRFVEKKLHEKWSPKQISGYLKREYDIHCSAKAIYKWVRRRSLEHLLFWGWNRRKSGKKRYQYNNPKDGRKYIDERPGTNNEAGHLEMDFIVSRQSTWVFLVATDRVTKHSFIEKLRNRKHLTVSQAFSRMFGGVTVKSITTDNDIAFGHWPELEHSIQAPIYFRHPYHSWEKGLVENTNRWIRCFVPKRRDIASVTGEEIKDILSFLYDRPREVIGFRKPSEYNYQLQSVLLRG